MFILGVVLDVVYQLLELHFVYPLQAIAVAIILALVPYVILRGLVTRLAGHAALRQHGLTGTANPDGQDPFLRMCH